jgi:hypothetical protein
MKLLNAFSLNMVADPEGSVSWREIPLDEARATLGEDFESAVGHQSTADVFASQLGCAVPCQRVTVALTKGDRAVVGQYRGPRLEEGATTLPDGATIKWYLIEVN